MTHTAREASEPDDEDWGPDQFDDSGRVATDPGPDRTTSPTQAVARRITETRRRFGWSAADLAERCGSAGFPGLNRSVIANIESGRRKYVTVDELSALAFVLNVAPVNLLVPTEFTRGVGREVYAVAGDTGPKIDFDDARAWVRGGYALPGTDDRIYWSETSRSEVGRTPTPPTKVQWDAMEIEQIETRMLSMLSALKQAQAGLETDRRAMKSIEAKLAELKGGRADV